MGVAFFFSLFIVAAKFKNKIEGAANDANHNQKSPRFCQVPDRTSETS